MGPEEEKREQLDEQFKRDAIAFIVNVHATIVNMRLYPLSSSMVTSTLEKSGEYLEKITEGGARLLIGALEGVILINECRLDDLEQQKPPVKAFATWLFDHGFTSIEFTPGITGEELRDVLELLVNSESDPEVRENLDAKLLERNVHHANINQRVYVSLESGTEIGEGGTGSPLDAMKDELLVRYLMGTVDLDNIEDREVMEVLSDSSKVGGMMSAFLSLEGADEGVVIKSQKAEDALRALYDMINKIEDEGLKEQLMGQVSSVIAEMSPTVMSSVLTSTPPADLDIHNLRKDVVTMLGDQKLLELIDALIGDYIGMKEESGELDVDWMRQKLVNFNQLFLEARVGEGGEELSTQIDKLLEDSGIQEEREPETGKKILSAYQLLGTPIEEEMVELGEGVDKTVSRQIYQLYAMGENELAEGFLNKICDNLDNESEKVRRFANTLLHDTIDGLDPEYGVAAGEIIEPILLERSKIETDYTAFTTGIDTLAIVAEHSLRKGQAGKASEIVEVLSVIDSHEQGKGSELLKHLKSVIEKMRGPDGIVSVHYILLEEDQKVRDDIIRELAKIGPGALSPLVDIVKDRGQVELQPRALEAFQVAGPAGVNALMDVLDKENSWYIYRNVLNAIADLGLHEAVPKVSDMVNNADERVRREAIRTLARLGNRESLPIIRNAITDPSPAVRQIAVRVLGVFNDKRVAPFLIELLNEAGPRGKNEDKGVVEAACLALGDLKDSDYIPNLIEVLGKGGLFRRAKPDEVRAAACIALGNIGDPIAEPILEKAASESSVMVASCASKALKKLRGAVTTPVPATEEEIAEAVWMTPSEQAAATLRSKAEEKAGEAPEPEPPAPTEAAAPAVETVEEAPPEAPPAEEEKPEIEELDIGAAGQALKELREQAPVKKPPIEELKVETEELAVEAEVESEAGQALRELLGEAPPVEEEKIEEKAGEAPEPEPPAPTEAAAPAVETVEEAPPEAPPAEEEKPEIEELDIGAAGQALKELREQAPVKKPPIEELKVETEELAVEAEVESEAGQALRELLGEAPPVEEEKIEEKAGEAPEPEPPAPTEAAAPAVETVEEAPPEAPPAEEEKPEIEVPAPRTPLLAREVPPEPQPAAEVKEEVPAGEAPHGQVETSQPDEKEERHPTAAEIEELRQLEEIEAIYESGRAEPPVPEPEEKKEEEEGIIERANVPLEELLATAEASMEEATPQVEPEPEPEAAPPVEEPVVTPPPPPEAPPEPPPQVEPETEPEAAPPVEEPVVTPPPEAPAEPAPEFAGPPEYQPPEAPPELPPQLEPETEPEAAPPVEEPVVTPPPEAPAEPAPEFAGPPEYQPPEAPPELPPQLEPETEPEAAPPVEEPVVTPPPEAPAEPAPEFAGPPEYQPPAQDEVGGPLIPEEEILPWELEAVPLAEEAPTGEDMMEEEPLDTEAQQEVQAGPENIPVWDYGIEDQKAPPEPFLPLGESEPDQGIQPGPPDSPSPPGEAPPDEGGLLSEPSKPEGLEPTGPPPDGPPPPPPPPKKEWPKPPSGSTWK